MTVNTHIFFFGPSWRKIIQPERISKLICNLCLYTLIPKIKSISPSIAKKVVTTKYLAKFQSSTAVSWPKIIQPEQISNMICDLCLYNLIPKIKSISPSIAKKVVTTKYLAKFQSSTAVSWPKIIQPERISMLICDLCLYTLIPKIKSISPSIAKKVVTTKYLAKFQSPRAITRPTIIGSERNVNLICNSSLYTHKPKIKSISPSIAEKSGDNLASKLAKIYSTGTNFKVDLYLMSIHSHRPLH